MLLFLDGQHHYATAQLSKKWTAAYAGSGPNTLWEIVAEGRTANAIRATALSTANNTAGYLDCAPLMTNDGPWTPTSSGAKGFAIKVEDLSKLSVNGVAAKQFFALYEGGGRIFYVILNPNGTFSHYYHEEAPLDTGYVGSSIQGIRSNTWAFVEFKWEIGLTEGRWETWVNDVKVFDITQSMAAGDRRVYGSSATYSYLGVWDSIRMLQLPMSSITSSRVWMCDNYLCDLETNGDPYVVNDRQGDGSIGAIYPEGIGTYAEWTPLAGDNWEEVAEHPPDGDTSYVSSPTSGVRDSHVMQDVPAGAVILGYQSLIYAKKTAVGSVILQPSRRMGGVDYLDEGQGVASSDDYSYIIQPYDNDPVDGTQATEADINGMQAGYKKEV